MDEESALLRGSAAPKYRTNLIVGALAAASFMFGVGQCKSISRRLSPNGDMGDDTTGDDGGMGTPTADDTTGDDMAAATNSTM